MRDPLPAPGPKMTKSKKHKIANISKTVHRTKKSMSSIFVRLVERNTMVFVSDRYDQYLVMVENVDFTIDLWWAFRPEVEFQNEAYGRKALY